MKILLCTAKMGLGGAETHILSLAKELSKDGHSVTLASEKGEMCKLLSILCKNVRFVRVPFYKSRLMSFFACKRVLSNLLENETFDVVHSHSRMQSYILSELKRKKGYKYKLCVTAHARYKCRKIEKRYSRWGDECICVSEDIKRHIVKNLCADESRITVIPNGVDTEHFLSCKKSAGNTVVFVSRLCKDCSEGAFVLCKIFGKLLKSFPDIKLKIVGNGDCYSEIKSACDKINRKIGEKRIEMCGGCTDIKPFLQDAGCVVGVSRVAIEAMALGKNVILFGNEGALGLLTENNFEKAAKTNFTCRGAKLPKSKEKFLFCEIKKCLSMKESKAKEISEFCKEKIQNEYSDKLMEKRTLEVYRKHKSPLEILIGGYYGFSNIGDETAVFNLVNGLERELNQVRICVLTNKGKKIGGLKVETADRKSLYDLKRKIKSCDLYIWGGGSILQNKTSMRSLLYYCMVTSYVKNQNKPYAFLSNGIGPLKNNFAVNLARNAILNAAYVSVRDEDSLIKSIALSKRKDIFLSGDLAFLDDNRENPNCQRNESLLKLWGGKYIAVALNGKRKKENEILVKGLKILAKKKYVPLAFVVMDKKQDFECSKRLATECKGLLIVPENKSEVMMSLENAWFAIGTRLHFLIFALLSNIPFVPVAADPKIDAFAYEVYSKGALEISYKENEICLCKKIVKYLENNKITKEKNRELVKLFQSRVKKDIKNIALICQRKIP